MLEAIGGFMALADYLADDFQIGNRVARPGQRVRFQPLYREDTVLPTRDSGRCSPRRPPLDADGAGLSAGGFAGSVMAHGHGLGAGTGGAWRGPMVAVVLAVQQVVRDAGCALIGCGVPPKPGGVPLALASARQRRLELCLWAGVGAEIPCSGAVTATG